MGIGELVSDGVSGLLVRPGRPELVADALERLARSRELRHSLAEAGRETVVREFNVHHSGAQIEAILHEMLPAAPPA
jgi:glycosyltransferase involved in cell wall biosynthesis